MTDTTSTWQKRVAQWPADDEDGRAGADRVARCPDAPLIAGRGTGGTNAGHHDHRARSESFSQRGDIRWSTNDSVGARVHRETRQPLHFRRRCLQRGEHRHREQLRLRQRAPGRADHLGAAARMYGDVLHSQPRDAARRAFHRLRNVVQFEIEKNRQPVAANRIDRRRPVRDEQLEADLEQADVSGELRCELRRRNRIGKIQRGADPVHFARTVAVALATTSPSGTSST